MSEGAAEVPLRDGTAVLVRPVDASDKEAIRSLG